VAITYVPQLLLRRGNTALATPYLLASHLVRAGLLVATKHGPWCYLGYTSHVNVTCDIHFKMPPIFEGYGQIIKERHQPNAYIPMGAVIRWYLHNGPLKGLFTPALISTVLQSCFASRRFPPRSCLRDS